MWHPDIRFVIVPGLHGSGPAHWQTLWEPALGASRVHQDDWSDPQLPRWSDRVVAALDHECRSAIVIAHSFGCLALVHAWPRIRSRVRAAMLVAPANPFRFGLSLDDVGGPLTAPSILVASRNDPWLPLDLAHTLSGVWATPLADIGAVGHINVESGHGTWREGWRLLGDLLQSNGLQLPSLGSVPAAGLNRVRKTFVL